MESSSPIHSAGHGLAWVKAQQRRRCARLNELQLIFADQTSSATTRVLEIGCGHGHWLAAYAAMHPRAGCLGIDLKTKRIHLASRKIEKSELTNLAFCKADAFEFLTASPESLRWDVVCLLFPDPWPKARHAKNRLVQEPLLSLLAERTGPGARLYFRTDNQPYMHWTDQRFNKHPQWEIAPSAPWLFEHETYFQKMATRFYSRVAFRIGGPLKANSTAGRAEE